MGEWFKAGLAKLGEWFSYASGELVRLVAESAPPIHAALISAAATFIAATITVLLVIWQIGKQARLAIKQNRSNEALKLKLTVYEEVTALAQEAIKAEVDLFGFVNNFKLQIAIAQDRVKQGLQVEPPSSRIAEFLRIKGEFDQKNIRIISWTERWQIIDPRIDLFRTALNASKHDLDHVAQAYFEKSFTVMPIDSSIGHVFWNMPTDDILAEYEIVSSSLLEKMMDVGSYIYDFQVEMQNLLVGELFGNKVMPREPIDPNVIVLTLDNYKNLMSHFIEASEWGKLKKNLDESFLKTICR